MLLADLCERWEDFRAACDLFLFGASTHDIGKCLHQNELYEEGHKHEAAGKSLLLSHGISTEKVKFAATHSS